MIMETKVSMTPESMRQGSELSLFAAPTLSVLLPTANDYYF